MHLVNVIIIHVFCCILGANNCQTTPVCSRVFLCTKVGAKFEYAVAMRASNLVFSEQTKLFFLPGSASIIRHTKRGREAITINKNLR